METIEIIVLYLCVVLGVTLFITMIYFSVKAEDWAEQNPEGTDLSKYHFIAIGCCWLALCMFAVFGIMIATNGNIMGNISFLVSLCIGSLILLIGGIVVNLQIHH